MRFVPLAAALSLLAAAPAAARPQPQPPASPERQWAAWQRHEALAASSPFHGLAWRSLGPTVQGGRVVDLEPIPGERYGFYVAYATGGVWKTTNNGGSFEPLSDGLPTMVTGDIAVDPTRPKRLWIGTGEPNSSRSSYGGMGVFRSDDGGATFERAGLADSDRIARIVVDPRDGSHVCVAALGKLYSTGGSRGVYCTRDDGASWTRVLAGDTPTTGAIDLVVDAKDPDVMYAALWDRSRTPWNLVETGRGSGVYKSSDAGRTWQRLAGGFPQGEKIGRIGLAVAASNPSTLYASVDDWNALPAALVDAGDRPLGLKTLRRMSKEQFLAQDPEEIETFLRGEDLDTALDAPALVAKVKSGEITIADLVAKLEAKDTGFGDVDIWGHSVWRSDDAGATWRRTHDAPMRDLTYTFGYYFGQIRVAPDDAERVYVTGVPLLTSGDGGRTFSSLQSPQVHVDYHAWWIDPDDTRRMVVGNDGGLDITYDGGRTWIKLDAQPVGQFYTVAVDMAEPYNIAGGLQDNGTLRGPSTARWELGETWTVIGGGDGMHVAVDTRDNQTWYVGSQFGYYQRKGPSGNQEVRPREGIREPALRYNWNAPIVLSPHNQDIVYYGANRLFRSMDQGETWTAISADLTTSKARGDVPFATITSVSESPKQFGLVWVGTDDGHVWVGTGGGDRWTAVDAKLPAERWVSRVIASAHARDRAYVALNGYRNDDPTPYLFRTDDLGRSWRAISAGLPAEPVNVVREDPVDEDVLYVGTDRGVYVTLDRGAAWTALAAGLPNVPVHDLAVHPRERELVAATHGRSMWVVDVLPVQEYAAVRDAPVHVFPLAPVDAAREWRSRPATWFDDAPSLPWVDVPFATSRAGRAEVAVLDANGSVVRRLALDAKPGVNRVRWDLLVDRELALAAERVSGKPVGSEGAPTKAAAHAEEPALLARTPYAESVRLGHRLFAVPGKYTVRVALDGAQSETPLEIKAPEPRKPRAKPPAKIRGR
jgi:photosystem II stability/assembly factor-like uncharacterized protein